MKVVLLEDVASVGKAGEVVDVADGFARNVLFPNGKAAVATSGRIAEVMEARSRTAKKAEAELAGFQHVVERVDRKTVRLSVPVGPQGRLHGAVTAQDVSDALERSFGIRLPVESVQLSGPIHEPGEYRVELQLPHGLEAEVLVVIDSGRPTTEPA